MPSHLPCRALLVSHLMFEEWKRLLIVSLSQGNDLSDLLKRIEQGLHSLHSQARETAMDSESEAARTAEEAGAPFARVMVVVSGSPADKAGIKQGDLVIKFGTVSKVGSSLGELEGGETVSGTERIQNVENAWNQ